MKLLVLLILTSCIFEKDKSPENKVLTKEEKIMRYLDDDTLLGPDKNNDGVRDDIEYWIKKNVEDENVKTASLLYAKYYRLKIKHVDDRYESIRYMKLKGQTSDCLYHLIGLYEKIKLRNKLVSLQSNNKDRFKAHWKADKNFRGQVSSSKGITAEETCPFKLR